MARSTICTFTALTTPPRCSAARTGNRGSNRSPSTELRGPTAAAARTRAAASPWGELQYPYQELGHGGRAVLPRQISGVGSGDQPVINQREFVADAFEALPHRDLLVRFEVIKPAGFDGADHIGESGSETIEGLIQRALVAFRCCGVPEFHVYILFETVFDDKSFS
jgi:hypothetical protein